MVNTKPRILEKRNNIKSYLILGDTSTCAVIWNEVQDTN